MTAAQQKTLVDRLYVVAQGGGIGAFDLFDDGSLSPLEGSPYPTGAGTFCIVASPDRRFVYVAAGMGLGTPYSLRQTFSPELITFRVRGDGTLSRAGELALPRLSTPVSMAMSGDGRNLYLGVGRGPAGFFRGGVRHFRIDEQGFPVAGGDTVRLGRFLDGAAQPVLSPDGRRLYIASVIAKALVRLDIQEDGSLSRPADRTPSTGTFPITPVFSPDGRFFYVANEQSQSITGFGVAADGTLTELPGSPYPTGKIPHNPVFSKDGRFVYFANTLSDTITGYEVQPDGRLVPVPGSPFRTPVGPAMLSRSSDGAWLCLVSSPIFRKGSRVVVTTYRIQSDGSLTHSGHEPAPTGLQFADGPSAVTIPVGG
ncbi:3-carboxymuconate cyclase [Nocardia nova SH22a]|uniref:3-carboxymuconate cyclase n=1 Tax=Nocardia nova SH22a TaxID=1415166 RepID=W5TK09_9NOCA|nr:beta-propeller fold lactonase family protein [Nocardia nova]AHH17576.1 3-carboxymuconate cyclase [Nocardia nova SH22a]